MIMKDEDIIGMAVVDLESATKLGTVADVIAQPGQQKVVGLVVQPVDGKADRWSLPLTMIHNVGKDAITLNKMDIPPTAGLALSSVPTLAQLHQVKVVTVGGTFVGHLKHLEFDTQTGNIAEYQLDGNFLERITNHEPHFPAQRVQSFSNDMMIITERESEEK